MNVAEQFYLRGVQDERQRVLNGLSWLKDHIGESYEVEGLRWAEGASLAVEGMKEYVTGGKVPPAPDDLAS